MEEEEENQKENAAFRKWVKEKFGIKPASNPMAIVRRAKKDHPDFQKWIKSVRPEK
jgi:hypothetical protein